MVRFHCLHPVKRHELSNKTIGISLQFLYAYEQNPCSEQHCVFDGASLFMTMACYTQS